MSSWRTITMKRAREMVRERQEAGDWPIYDLTNLCGLSRHDFEGSVQYGAAPPEAVGSSGYSKQVRSPVLFAAWLEERLRREEEYRERVTRQHGAGAVRGGRSRGVNRAKLRRAITVWTEEAVRWVAMGAARFHTGPSGGERLWGATVAEVERWVATRSPGERSALLTLWRVSGGGEGARGPVVQLMARSGVWRRAAKRAVGGGATPSAEEPPPPSPGSSVPAHPPPPPPP